MVELLGRLPGSLVDPLRSLHLKPLSTQFLQLGAFVALGVGPVDPSDNLPALVAKRVAQRVLR